MTDLRSRVLSAFRWAAMARFVGQTISWGMSLVVVRLLTPGDYGQLALATMFTTTLGLMSELGLGAALVQQGRQLDTAYLRQIFGMVLMINMALFIGTILLAPAISWLFNEPSLVSILCVLSVQFILQAFVIIPQSLLQRELDFKNKSIIDVVATLAGGTISLALAIGGQGVWALVWGSLANILVRAVGLNVIVAAPLIPSFHFRGLAQSCSFGGYVTANRALWAVYSQADIFIAGKLLGKELLGIYSMAMELASLPIQKFNGLINEVAFPAFARLQNDREQLRSHFLKGVRIISIVAFPVFWGLSTISIELVDVVLGERWHAVGAPMRLLAILMPFQMLINLVYTILQGIGRPEMNVMNMAVTILIMPAAFYLGAGYGVEGLCYAWLVAYPVVCIVTLRGALPAIGVSAAQLASSMAMPFIAGLGIVVAVSAVRITIPSPTVSPQFIILYIALGVVVYMGILVGLYRNGCRELYQLVRE